MNGINFYETVGSWTARAWNGHNKAVGKAMGRIASGLRLGSAADDPADMARAERFRAQLTLLVCERDALLDTSANIDVKDALLEAQSSIIQRMRELALKASSDQFADECGQLDAEYQQLLEELNRIGNSKAFDGKALFGATQTEGPDTLRVSQEEMARYFEALDAETARIATEGLEENETLNRHLADFARDHFAANPPKGSGKAGAAYYRVTLSKEGVTVAFGRPDLSAFGLGGTSLANAESAREAIGRLDEALREATQRRGDYGATQSKMEHVVSYLNQLEEILTGVLSRINDADMAKEIMTYLREQMVGQATAYAMAHSNERTDGLVSLLKQA